MRTLLPPTLLLTCKCNTWSVNYFPKFLIVLVVLASLWVVVVGERIAGVYAGWRIEGLLEWGNGEGRFVDTLRLRVCFIRTLNIGLLAKYTQYSYEGYFAGSSYGAQGQSA